MKIIRQKVMLKSQGIGNETKNQLLLQIAPIKHS